MKMKTLLVATLGLMAVAVPTVADAAPWTNINQRQAALFDRIQHGMRNGSLTRGEGFRLMNEVRGLTRLETVYRRSGGGLDFRERADLNRRFDALNRQVRFQRNDWQRR